MYELERPLMILFLIMTLTDSNKQKLVNAFINLFSCEELIKKKNELLSFYFYFF